MANSSTNLVFTGLGTLTYVIPAAGSYTFKGSAHVPTATENAGTGGNNIGPSQVVIVIKQNGTTVYTGSAGDQGFKLSALNCALSDSITFTTSSSAAVDQGPNAVKLSVAIY